jgi:phosphopantothenoylcysteine decarboxylase / phosphopantothenate---cysteine ligase
LRKLKKILITAGPTREMLDPVRFLSNVSTGEMGYTMARVAKAAGYQVTLISGPTHLQPPAGVRFVPITTARELKRACEKSFPKQDALIMTAAVCDFTSASPSHHKIRRTQTHELHLIQTPDILASLSARKKDRTVIGFCLETRDWLKNAQHKLTRKKLDGIVANYYTKTHIPFGNRLINTAFLDRKGKVKTLTKKSKKQVSKALLKWLENLHQN